MDDTDPRDGSDPMNREWWNIETFATYLSVSQSTFYRMRQLGHLPPTVMKVGRCLYWKREDVIKWVEDNWPNEDNPDDQ